MSEEMPRLARFERREVDVVLTYDTDAEFTITYDDIG